MMMETTMTIRTLLAPLATRDEAELHIACITAHPDCEDPDHWSLNNVVFHDRKRGWAVAYHGELDPMSAAKWLAVATGGEPPEAGG